MKRRDFVLKTTLAGSAVLASPYVSAFRGAPNNKVIVGVMGTNSRGEYLATLFSALPDVEVGYICEVDETVLQRTIAKIESLTGKKPKGFTDVRKLLEEKDLDAIAIAAPDHWHAPAALMAVKAGKHVYVEKPCSHNPGEGEILVRAAEKYKKLIQMGNQRRSWPGVQEAMQSLKDGVIGRPYYAQGWYANSRKSIGLGKEVTVPSTLDFNLWQGPAPRKSYKDNLIHYNWHWFWHWGTGEALNNGTHELDLMRWGLGVDYPLKVTSIGGRFHYKDDWQTPDTQTISYEFANNTAISWEGRSCNGYPQEGSGRGVIFYGERGSMVIPGGDSYKIYDLENKVVKEVKSPLETGETTNTTGMGEKLDSLHLLNFINTIRENEKLNSPIAEGHKSTLLPQLGNIAFRSGKILSCDATGQISDKKVYDELWAREYEKGWEMKL